MLILIAGGTGSGKTTVANKLVEYLGNAVVLSIDRYYRDLSHLPPEERIKTNFDDPAAIEWPLLEDHARRLLKGEAVDVPIYDFKTHTRRGYEPFSPAKYLIIEGIFALWHGPIRDLAALRIYIDTPADIRFLRRLRRDIQERGRTPESVCIQWERFVHPSHERFVEPTKRFAHVILPEDPDGNWREKAIKTLVYGLINLKR